MPRTPTLLALLAALCLLGGCSTVRLAYNQLDHLAAWTADDYFDLTPEQKQAFRVQFERMHAWHRQTQLADYAALLDTAQQRIAAGATEADVIWLTDALQARLAAMVRHAWKDAAALLSSLSDEQIRAARREFDQRNRKYGRDIGLGAPPDEQRRLRADRHLERIEHWTGALDAAQAARVREMSRALPLLTEQRYQERLRRQGEFLELLQQRRQTDTFGPRLRDWLLDWNRSRPPAYQAQHNEFMQASARMHVALLLMLTPEQRRHLTATMERYQRTFRDLAKEPARPQAALQP